VATAVTEVETHLPTSPPEAPAEPLLRHVAIALSFLLLMTAGQYVVTKELADIFDPDAYGLVQIVFQIGMLAPMLFGLQLTAGLRYYAAQARTGRPELRTDRVLGVTLALSVWLHAAMALVLILAAGPLAQLYDRAEFAGALRIMAPFLIAVALLNVLQAVLNAQKRFVVSCAQLVCRVLAPPVGALVAGWISRGSAQAAALGYGLGLVAVVLLWVWPMRRRLHVDFRVAEHRVLIASLMRYSLPVYAGELVKAGLRPLLVMLVGLIALQEAGFVQIAITTVAPGFIVAFSLRIVAVPLIAERPSRTERRAMADVLVRWHNLMLLPVLLVLAVAGPAFIRWYYKPEFHQAARYLPLLLVMLAGNSTVRIISHVLMGLGHPSAYAKMVGVVVLVAVPGMVWSTLTGGSPATVLWWLIAGWLAGGVIALWLVIKHRAGIHWLQTYFQPIGLAVATALPILIAQRLAPSLLWIVVPLAVAVYAFGAYRLARTRARQGQADLRRLQVPVADAYTTSR